MKNMGICIYIKLFMCRSTTFKKNVVVIFTVLLVNVDSVNIGNGQRHV